MNAFHKAKIVEAEGWRHVELWVRDVSGGSYVPLFDDADAQRKGYDVLAVIRGAQLRLELKCEQEDKFGNFFLETWSNKCFGRSRDGWMFTCQADQLLYYFLAGGDLYVIDRRRLWSWFFGEPPDPAAMFFYPEKQQTRHKQLNATCGHPVPIRDIAKYVGVYHARRNADGSFLRIADTRDCALKATRQAGVLS